ncbi:hypothetical protein [Kitasatospora sp. McL0602]|uniref:hypothetical protein n=1 Tax=Kitasatospora sp. McL0602 TaxID=3439530 RepID=UPI003F8CE28B
MKRTPPPLSRSERQALDDLTRRGARALNPVEGNRLLRLLEHDHNDRAQERRTAGGLQNQAHQLRAQLRATETRLATFHEGEEPYNDERLIPTAAQWIWQWNRATPEQRLATAELLLDLQPRLNRAHEVLTFHGDRPGWQEAVHAALSGSLTSYPEWSLDAPSAAS